MRPRETHAATRPGRCRPCPCRADAHTPYDKEHAITYMRMLDADAEGADWREVSRIVLHKLTKTGAAASGGAPHTDATGDRHLRSAMLTGARRFFRISRQRDLTACHMRSSSVRAGGSTTGVLIRPVACRGNAVAVMGAPLSMSLARCDGRCCRSQ
jgi:hypothetical protein